jgi:integrase
LTADAVTICLENQKNGHKNATLHHTTSHDSMLDPVHSAVMLIHALQGLPGNTPIGSFSNNGRLQHISADEIRALICMGATHDNLPAQGYTLSRIGSHSLRSGGAMHLKLAGYDNDIIQKLGRWSSTTYLHYIQTQIGQLTTGVAQRMANISLRFHIVA